MSKVTFQTDDEYFTQSKLIVSSVSELHVVEFKYTSQRGGDETFYLYKSDIPKLIKFLENEQDTH
jgi:Holliday junction resolvase